MIISFELSREALLKPCQRVIGAVERRHTLPVLGNLLFVVKNQLLSITGTDLEIEMVARIPLESPAQDGAITVPARKLVDICKALPENALLQFSASDPNKAKLQAGKSKFSLACLPSDDFPTMEEGPGTVEFSMPQNFLCQLLDGVSFAMAQQDSRYYLNGMLFEIIADKYRVVSADGHRLSLMSLAHQNEFVSPVSIIIPRKAVLELLRLFSEGQDEIGMVVGDNHLRAITPQLSFTTKLIDGNFPDFRRVLPVNKGHVALVDRDLFKSALSRIAVLLNDKRQGVGLHFQQGKLQILARNNERDEGEEELEIDYQEESIEIGFNVHYLIEYLSHVKSQTIKITLAGSDQSVLFEPAVEGGNGLTELYVVMPMRL